MRKKRVAYFLKINHTSNPELEQSAKENGIEDATELYAKSQIFSGWYQVSQDKTAIKKPREKFKLRDILNYPIVHAGIILRKYEKIDLINRNAELKVFRIEEPARISGDTEILHNLKDGKITRTEARGFCGLFKKTEYSIEALVE